MIMDNLTPHIEVMREEVHSFKSEIYQGAGETADYSKTITSPPGIFTSLQEIQAYIKECEQKRLDLENAKLWSKAYLLAALNN